eukprot:2858970-Amphidinium_carterae.1
MRPSRRHRMQFAKHAAASGCSAEVAWTNQPAEGFETLVNDTTLREEAYMLQSQQKILRYGLH